MFDMDRITIDSRSGQPEPPISWRLTTIFVIYGFLMAIVFLGLALMAVREGETEWAVASALTAAFFLLLVHWRKKQVLRAQARFAEMVADYERVLTDARH